MLNAQHRAALDQSGKILSIAVLEGTAGSAITDLPRVALTINANGEIIEKSSFSTLSSTYYFALVDGEDLWINSANTVSHATRGAVDTILVNSVTTQVGVLQGQIVGTKMFFGFINGDGGNIDLSVVDPLPKTAGNAATRINTGGMPTQTFFAYDPTTFYTSSETLAKRILSGTTLNSEYVFVGTNDGSLARSIIAKSVDGNVYIFVLGDNGKIRRYRDNGSDLVEATEIVSGDATTMFCLALTPEPTCDDSLKNQDETDVDCGGSTSCSDCEDSKACLADSDCVNNYCNPDKICCKSCSRFVSTP